MKQLKFDGRFDGVIGDGTKTTTIRKRTDLQAGDKVHLMTPITPEYGWRSCGATIVRVEKIRIMVTACGAIFDVPSITDQDGAVWMVESEGFDTIDDMDDYICNYLGEGVHDCVIIEWRNL